MSCDTSLTAPEAKRMTKKLKNEDPDQFQTLVRMHLSFVLDLNVDETDAPAEKNKFRPLKWPLVPFSKKKNILKSSEALLTPQVVDQILVLTKFLSDEDNLKQEGIFRRSGKVTRQNDLKNLLNKGIVLDFDEGLFSVHDCASVLKNYLADLPEPLLTEAHYPAYLQIAELFQSEKWSQTRMLRAVQLLLLLLPSENRRLLKDLIQLLHETSLLVDSNRMSAENLATLFTPHLLCPRKLSPEVFHTNSQILTCIVVFMINEGQNIFEVPMSLATDVKAYWDERRRTPDNMLEQSVSEGTAAKTIYSFVDRERTAQENIVNPTETALAQLYAHIQSLPESNKKKRLIKQFNKENGYGTPRTSTLATSIKKHIFTKSQKVKDLDETGIINCDAILNTPIMCKVRQKLHMKCERDRGSKTMEVVLPVVAEPTSPEIRPLPGSDGDSEEQETCCGPIGLQSMPPDNIGGTQHSTQSVELLWGVVDEPVQGLPVQSECADILACGSLLLEPGGGLRSLGIRRRRSRRRWRPRPTVLPSGQALPPLPPCHGDVPVTAPVSQPPPTHLSLSHSNPFLRMEEHKRDIPENTNLLSNKLCSKYLLAWDNEPILPSYLYKSAISCSRVWYFQ